ncbi:hypothetical protein OXPF_27240 [Oxobacter pfennigii]|uniref:Lipoprotein n=1 Tax=Oxobacter pfennigii TaxID=36849 RepID=A0A0P8YUA6_9CLOT|nr:hypothetical protein [Oxobacter pfennigii]KPU43283.1 hypothetical protein OXPF_27240 [Oxobacter pfennigii]
MYKKTLFLISIVIIHTLLLTGCFNKEIKLDYIQVPDEIFIQSYENKDDVDKLGSELKELKTKGAGMEEQRKVLDKIGKLFNESRIQVKDKDFINKVIREIQNSEGIIEVNGATLPKSEVIFRLQFNYENIKKSTVKKNGNTTVTEVTNNTLNDLNQVYIIDITIFSDGTTLVPRYDKTDPSNTVIVKAKLDQEIIDYITDFYSSRKK